MTKTRVNSRAREGVNRKVIRFFLEQKLVVFFVLFNILFWGIRFAPFDWDIEWLPRDPVPVDAIPDIGENQQIVFTSWSGRSPRDVEDQVTYPLSTTLLGVAGVESIRCRSMFGFSSIYVTFEEKTDFYWARSRILEKLAGLPDGTLPEGVKPSLGPDATALGQVFWYTLEGRDEQGRPAGGWGPEELRSIQDWQVRFALMSVKGVAEVASVGGFVKEYQVDVDPDELRAYGVTLEDVFRAVRMSNLDVGARTIEINRVEYVVRGIGNIDSIEDIRNTVVKTVDDTPVYVKDIAHVGVGPAERRGMLDKDGAEAVGGVVVARHGENPLAIIKRVKEKIAGIAPSLPVKNISDGRTSRVTVVPFYDRTSLIHETLGTLKRALSEEILVTIVVVMVMVMNLRVSLVVSTLLPLSVLMCFVAMKLGGVDANIVALSGIAIAIGTIVDMGIVICENVLQHVNRKEPGVSGLKVVLDAVVEVSGAVVTAISTTLISFLPVFVMTGPEGKLFKPLAYTKTFVLLASVVIALIVLPAFAHIAFARVRGSSATRRSRTWNIFMMLVGLGVGLTLSAWAGLLLSAFGVYGLIGPMIRGRWRTIASRSLNWFVVFTAVWVLTGHWLPLGPENGMTRNLVFTGGLLGVVLGGVKLWEHFYESILRWSMAHRGMFSAGFILMVLLGLLSWLGFERLFGFLPARFRAIRPVVAVAHAFPGLGREFMPPLDEGSFLLMPTTMPHASIGEAADVLKKQDAAIRSIPEVETVVGKVGRAESPLDPAPVSMIETIINYSPEYIQDSDGKRKLFKFDKDKEDVFRDEQGNVVLDSEGKEIPVEGRFVRVEGALVEDGSGRPFRLWRPGIRDAGDIWDEIVRVSRVPGTTGAPRLQPIAARLVMLQSGVRAPMGIRISGPDLKTIERTGLDIEKLLKSGGIPGVNPDSAIADRLVAKPYLELDWDREALDRYGIQIAQAQELVEVAVGGKPLTLTVEGRERYPVRVRYMREFRDSIEALGSVLVSASDGRQIPVRELVKRRASLAAVDAELKKYGIDKQVAVETLLGALKEAGISTDDVDAGTQVPFPVLIRDARDFIHVKDVVLDTSLRRGDREPVLIGDLLKVSYPRTIWYRRGPMVISSEDTRLVGYVLFDMKSGNAEVDVVESVRDYLRRQESVFNEAHARLVGETGGVPSQEDAEALPGLNRRGCVYDFIGTYRNQVRSRRTLMMVLPVALVTIFFILYLQFRSITTTALVFSGILLAWSGGFILLWLYGQGWFLDFRVFGISMREFFQVHQVNLSVAVWVGFLALFGIATDDGVVVATYLDQSFSANRPRTPAEVRAAAVEAGLRRVKPCLMTSATTILALIPVLSSTGRGSDVMAPMAIPTFGGMTVAMLGSLAVTVFYSWIRERQARAITPIA